MIEAIRSASRALVAVGACCAVLLRSAVPASADSSEIAVLKKIPAVVLNRLSVNAKPDASGAMQINVGGWKTVVYQRIAIPLIYTGAAEDDESKVDEGWKAIDLAFTHQLSDGSFETSAGTPTRPTDMSFWLAAVCDALLVVQESSLAGRYQAKIAALKPKIAKATAWLEQPANERTLFRGDYRDDGYFASNRLFVDATAYMTASRLLGDPAPLAYARLFLAQAVNRQTSDGVFPENGGFDSSYQCVSLYYATQYAIRDPAAPGLRNALEKGLQREVASVDSTGTLDVSKNTRTNGQERIFGQVKRPELGSVVLALYFSGNYLDDSSGVQAGARAFQKAFHLDPNS